MTTTETDGAAIECAIDDLIRAAEGVVSAYETGRGMRSAEGDLQDAKRALLSLVDSLRSQVAEMGAALEIAQKDSLRLDWIERERRDLFTLDGWCLTSTDPLANAATVREAIDAARNLTPDKAAVQNTEGA